MTADPFQLPHLDEVLAAAEAAIEAAKQPVQIRVEDAEPRLGSIVLVTSDTGTAAQRFYSDGLWHHTTGGVSDWPGLFMRRDGRSRDVFLVWQAPVDGGRPHYVPGSLDVDAR